MPVQAMAMNDVIIILHGLMRRLVSKKSQAVLDIIMGIWLVEWIDAEEELNALRAIGSWIQLEPSSFKNNCELSSRWKTTNWAGCYQFEDLAFYIWKISETDDEDE